MNEYNDVKNEFIIEDGGNGGDVIIPDGIRDIFFQVFYGLVIIDSITIPGSIIEITPYVFEASSLKMVKMKEGVSVIGISSFNDCNNLEIIYLPKSITTIQMKAFANCTSLKKIYYNGSKKDWDLIIKEANWDYNTNNYEIIFKK